MRVIILVFALLQLWLITANPEAKMEAHPKESKVKTKGNFSKMRKLGFFENLVNGVKKNC